MAWTIKLTETAVKSLRNLDPQHARRITRFLRTRVDQNPRDAGKALKGASIPLWRYRVGHYRLICEIRDSELLVLVVRVGHRRDVYRK